MMKWWVDVPPIEMIRQKVKNEFKDKCILLSVGGRGSSLFSKLLSLCIALEKNLSEGISRPDTHTSARTHTPKNLQLIASPFPLTQVIKICQRGEII